MVNWGYFEVFTQTLEPKIYLQVGGWVKLYEMGGMRPDVNRCAGLMMTE